MDKFANDTVLGYFWQRIKTVFGTKEEINTALQTKVDKIDGMGLSTNDYTNGEKSKLENVESGAQVNVIENVSVNGTTQPVTSKRVNVTVPTDTSQLSNGAGFLDTIHVQDLINDSMGDITGIEFVKVDTLPDVGAKGIIYLVPKTTPEQSNVYDEWIYVATSGWEKIGSTDIDLSQYWSRTELVPITTAEIDAITI